MKTLQWRLFNEDSSIKTVHWGLFNEDSSMNSFQRRLFIEEPKDINSSTACLLLGQRGCWRWKDCTHVYSIIHSFNKMLIVAIKTLNSCLFQNFQPGSQVALWSDKRCWLLNFSGLLGEQKLPTVKTLHSCLPQNIQPLPLIGQDVDCCFHRRHWKKAKCCWLSTYWILVCIKMFNLSQKYVDMKIYWYKICQQWKHCLLRNFQHGWLIHHICHFSPHGTFLATIFLHTRSAYIATKQISR